MDIDSKLDAIVVDYEDNCRALVAASVRDKLNERIKVLEAKKTQITFEAKLCSLEQERAQEYLEANASMGSVTSLKNILAIEYSQVCPDPSKYNGKSMRHYKAYKRAVEYTLGERPFTYCTNKKKCTYAGQFLMGISAKHWETMETRIKEFLILKFNYKVFMEMLKEHLLPRKVHQIEVRIKLKSLC